MVRYTDALETLDPFALQDLVQGLRVEMTLGLVYDADDLSLFLSSAAGPGGAICAAQFLCHPSGSFFRRP